MAEGYRSRLRRVTGVSRQDSSMGDSGVRTNEERQGGGEAGQGVKMIA